MTCESWDILGQRIRRKDAIFVATDIDGDRDRPPAHGGQGASPPKRRVKFPATIESDDAHHFGGTVWLGLRVKGKRERGRDREAAAAQRVVAAGGGGVQSARGVWGV